MSQEDRRAFYHEHVQAMCALWHSRQAVQHKGEFFEFDNAAIMPPPLSEHPPF